MCKFFHIKRHLRGVKLRYCQSVARHSHDFGHTPSDRLFSMFLFGVHFVFLLFCIHLLVYQECCGIDVSIAVRHGHPSSTWPE